jgi:nicotinamidase-related amidase
MGRQVLVVIDPQNDFTSSEGNYARRHSGISQILNSKYRIRNLLNAFEVGETVIVSSDYKAEQFGKGLSICIPGTFGHNIDADLSLPDKSTFFTKTQYSCFSSGEFIRHLKNNKIDSIILCGFLAEYCVKQTALDALELGYKVSLVEDCIATGDDVQERKHQAIHELKVRGAIVVDSEAMHRADGDLK